MEIRDRTDDCVSSNGFCPEWIVENADRYVDPFWQHVFLTVTSVAFGFAIAFTLGVLAHRRRWLVAPITNATGIFYTIPSAKAIAKPSATEATVRNTCCQNGST